MALVPPPIDGSELRRILRSAGRWLGSFEPFGPFYRPAATPRV